MTSRYFIEPRDHVGTRDDKAYKHTFFQSERLLTGLNCLQPGQGQHIHIHAEQDKFYLVLAGVGRFSVDGEEKECGPGELILAPAGIDHGVTNDGDTVLTFMTVIAPFPS